MKPEAAIDALAEALSVGALGSSALSHGQPGGAGTADEHSDLDFVAVVADDGTAYFSAIWRGALSRTGEIVLW